MPSKIIIAVLAVALVASLGWAVTQAGNRGPSHIDKTWAALDLIRALDQRYGHAQPLDHPERGWGVLYCQPPDDRETRRSPQMRVYSNSSLREVFECLSARYGPEFVDSLDTITNSITLIGWDTFLGYSPRPERR